MSAIRFTAKPYAIGTWTILQLPHKASGMLPSRGQVMVTGTLNGRPFQAALEPDGNGGHWLNVDKHLRQAAAVRTGETVSLEIEPTKDWPEPDIPADVLAAVTADADIQALWQDITPMARWEWLRWIGSTAQPATRQKRIEVSCSKLRAGSRRPCCFNRNMCCVPEVSKSGVLLAPVQDHAPTKAAN